MKTILLISFVASAAGALAQGNGSALANLSSRGLVGSGAGSLIAGFVIEGTTPKQVLVRGVGPGLADFGVQNPAGEITVNVFDSTGAIVASNAGNLNDPNAAAVAQTAAQLGAFPLTRAGDSAMLATLPPGAYSVEIAPDAADAPDGTALLEVYDTDMRGSSNSSVITNLSTRGEVGTTAGTMISGFNITGGVSMKVLIRGVGPELSQFGVTNPAPVVGINVFDAQGNLVASNDGVAPDPAASATAQIANSEGAFPITEPGSSELAVTLPAGSYTVEATPASSDAADAPALIEIFDADNAPAPVMASN